MNRSDFWREPEEDQDGDHANRRADAQEANADLDAELGQEL